MPNLQGFCQLCTDLHTDGVCQPCLLMDESARNAFALNNESTMYMKVFLHSYAALGLAVHGLLAAQYSLKVHNSNPLSRTTS